MRIAAGRRHERDRPAKTAGSEPSADRLRVLFVHTATQPPLGADTWVHAKIMATLDRATHEVHAACNPGPRRHPTPTYTALAEIPDLPLVAVNLGPELSGRRGVRKVTGLLSTVPALFGMLRLAAYVRRHRIQLIHTSDRPRDAFACVLVSRMTGALSVVHVHVGIGEWMRPMLRWSLRRADALVAVSAFVARTVVDTGHASERTHIVLNAIEPNRWQPGTGRDEARREFGVHHGAPLILTACRLFPSKGAGDLIQALPGVHREHPDARLVIVGQEMVSGYAAELGALADHLGVSDHVVLTGRRADVHRLMAAADVFAMPSLGEPFGLVYAEAMAMELPVVALNSGGAPEVVEDGVTGLLSAPGDIDGLAANLSSLLSDPARRARMGAAGRRRVEERFTVERMARDMARVYRDVLASDAVALESERGRDGAVASR